MSDADQIVDAIAKVVGERFATFGGNRGRRDNPVAAALDGGELVFAAGVSVRDVVICALVEWEKRTRDTAGQPGTQARG